MVLPAFLAVPCQGSARETAFTAVVTSDLHYTANKNVSNIIVPGMAFVDEITDAIIEMVLDQKPDALILTGDNTNGGSKTDAVILAEKLKRVKDAGIQVVITTGNHDFNQSSPEDFEKIYYGLPEMTDRDAYSLSYTTLAGDAVLLAMDDSAVDPGGRGEFSPSTMAWLEEMLDKYAEHPVLFLSHHNVLIGKESENSESYHIQNKELPALLQSRHVSLALTGHLHSQMIARENGLYEIVSAMPLAGSHMTGFLEISGNSLHYETRDLDFRKYGSGDLADALSRIENENSLAMRESFIRTLEASDYSAEEKEDILELIFRFLSYYSRGDFGDHVEEIRQDPSYEKMIDALWNYNYGPWMKAMVDNPPLNACRLDLTLNME